MIIPLKKIIEYKGNKYELARSMIELAREGRNLLHRETAANNDKYIPVVIKNLIEGKIKFGYEDESREIAPEAPFLHTDDEYDETQFAIPEPPKTEKEEEDEDLDDDEDAEDEDDATEDETSEEDD